MHIVYMVAIALACCVYSENNNVVTMAWMELRRLVVSSGEQLPHSGETFPVSFPMIMLILAALICISYVVIQCLKFR